MPSACKSTDENGTDAAKEPVTRTAGFVFMTFLPFIFMIVIMNIVIMMLVIYPVNGVSRRL
jgi:hypothetical protein